MSALFEDGELLCGRFELVRFLARGTVGEGYVAHDTLLNERVVCKVALDTSERARGEFRAQYRKLRGIRSPGVVEALGFHEHEGRPLIHLEWIDGLDLPDWSKGKTLKQRLDAVADIATALSALHAAGIAHGLYGEELTSSPVPTGAAS